MYIKIIFFSFILTSVFSQNTSHIQNVLQAKLDSLNIENSYPGATFGVSLSTGDNFGIATGYSDLENKVKMRPNDVMLLGSVGKTYYSAIALKLVSEKKLNLDEKISHYLKGVNWFPFVQNKDDVTIRMLMNHTSGIDRYVFQKTFTDIVLNEPNKYWTVYERVLILKDSAAAFKAGTDFLYSDLNYIILGAIIEKVSKRSMYDLVDDHIIKKHELFETYPSNSTRIPGLIPGYPGDQDPLGVKGKTVKNGIATYNLQFEWTGGGIAASTRDLAKWAKLLYEFNIFPENLKNDYTSKAINKNKRSRKSYGLGTFIFELPVEKGVIAYGHEGFMPGYWTEMIYIPKYKVAFAMVMNTTDGQYVQKFYEDYFSLIKTYIDKFEK